MKRRDLEKHLREHGCHLHHHGSDHDMWVNAATENQSAVPRHRELRTNTARAICRSLKVPPPPGR